VKPRVDGLLLRRSRFQVVLAFTDLVDTRRHYFGVQKQKLKVQINGLDDRSKDEQGD
jgi:hypothetical protein